MSCTIYKIKDKKPVFKEIVIAYANTLENSNATIDFEIEYWTDYPVFETSKICE